MSDHPESGPTFYAKTVDLARFSGFPRPGLDRAAICITIGESPRLSTEKARRSDRRSFLLGSGAIALLGAAAFERGARAQSWPARPVRIIVRFPPGGLTDLYARLRRDDAAGFVPRP